MISTRARQLIASPSPIQAAHARCALDPFSASHNPPGYIHLGTAENYLVWDLLAPKLHAPRGITDADTHYNPTHGTPDFRAALARFLRRRFALDVGADDLALANGATSILDMLAYTLGEPGDAFLVPTPYYPGFRPDFAGRAGMTVAAVTTHATEGFRLTADALITAQREATARGIRTRGLLITNPTNPLGTVLTPAELETAVAFCESERLHCIFDEIYGGTLHVAPGEPSTPFTSALATFAGRNERRLHFIYGFSKDFSLSGFRVGVFHSPHPEVRAAMRALTYFNNVSVDTQRLLTELLDDEAWVDTFLAQNSARLGVAFAGLKKELEAHTPIRVWPARAGVFAWADFSFALSEPSFAAETALYETILRRARVNLLPGQHFQAAEPGWFRICYAHDAVTLRVATERLRALFSGG